MSLGTIICDLMLTIQQKQKIQIKIGVEELTSSCQCLIYHFSQLSPQLPIRNKHISVQLPHIYED